MVARVALLLSAHPPIRPSALLAQCPNGSPPPCPSPTAPRIVARSGTPSLAVLYLDNGSPDSNDVALSDGITEEVITRLSQVPGLQVTSRYASVRFRTSSPVDPRLAGRTLGVRYVLQGTLRRSNDRVRVQIAMTDVSSGFNVWAQTYDQAIRDVFALQDSVAVQVAEAVRGRLTRQELAHLTPLTTMNAAAYQAFLRGRAALRARTTAAAITGIREYARAITLDTNFSRAYAGLAQAYSLARDWGWKIPGVPQSRMDCLSLEGAARALALDSTSADSWLAAAMAQRNVDMHRSLEYHRRAIRLDSTNVEVLHQLAPAYYAFAQFDSALGIERRAVARDPFYAYPYGYAAWVLNTAGRPREALAWAAQGIAVDSTFGPIHWFIADAYLQLRQADDARASARRALRFGQDSAPMVAMIAMADWLQGDTALAGHELEEAAQVLRARSAEADSGISFLLAYPVAGAYAQMGQADSALAWLGRVDGGMRKFFGGHLLHHWIWNPLRADSRFQALVVAARP